MKPKITGPVIYLDRENPEHLIRKRLMKLFGTCNIPGFHYFHYPPLKIDTTEGRELLRSLVIEIAPACVIMDTFSKFHNKNENAAEDMNPIMDGIKDILNETKSAFVFEHHFGKDKDRDAAHRSRGSSVLLDAPDHMWALEKTDGDARKLSHKKSRHDMKAENLIIEINDIDDDKIALEVIGIGSDGSMEKNMNDLCDLIIQFKCRENRAPSKKDLLPSLSVIGWSLRTLERTAKCAASRGKIVRLTYGREVVLDTAG